MATNYPEDIYLIGGTDNITVFEGRDIVTIAPDEVIDALEHAYDLGKKQQDAGDWHDLTAAIKAGEPIHYKKLRNRKIKCEHKVHGSHVFTLNRDDPHGIFPPGSYDGWMIKHNGESPGVDFAHAWSGEYGWALYVDGPIPLKRKTADQLEAGHWAIAEWKNQGHREFVMMTDNGWLVTHNGATQERPKLWTVCEELGKLSDVDLLERGNND